MMTSDFVEAFAASGVSLEKQVPAITARTSRSSQRVSGSQHTAGPSILAAGAITVFENRGRMRQG